MTGNTTFSCDVRVGMGSSLRGFEVPVWFEMMIPPLSFVFFYYVGNLLLSWDRGFIGLRQAFGEQKRNKVRIQRLRLRLWLVCVFSE